jgi:hypothetical protein
MSIASLLNYFKTAPKGTTVAGAPTSISVDTNTQALHIVNAATNTTVNGILTASDAVVAAPIGDGTLISGASTAGSIVYVSVPDGYISWTMMIKGYVSGTIYAEASNNTTNGTDGDWVEVKGRRTGTAVGTESVIYAMVSNGYYRGNAAGFKAVRARLIGGTGPTIQFVISRGMGATFLNSGIPSGSSAIGSINITSGNTNIGARPDGPLKVISDPTTLLIDTHDSAPDTVNTWTQGGITPTWATGSVTYPAGTVASASSYMYTKFMTAQAASSFIQFASVYTLDAAVVTGNKRVWGLGTIAGAPTAAVPLANGAVFEISDVDGLLYAVIYSNSVRGTAIMLPRPTDGGPHRYVIYYKTSKVFFELDNVVVATITNPNNIAAIAGGIAGSFNGTTTLAAAATLVQSVLSIADPARNNTKVSDGTFPWRTQKVSAAGSANVQIDQSANPNLNVLPGQLATTTGTITTATSIIGPINVSGYNVASLVTSGTYAGVTAVFEATVDGTTWFAINGYQATTSTLGSGWYGIASANGINQVDLPMGAYTQLRIRASAYTSGTLTVSIGLKAIAAATVSTAITQGVNASGVPTTVNPVLIGGTDGTNARTMNVGVNGGVSIKGSSIPGTSGSIAAAGTGTIGPLAVGEAGNCTFVIKNTVAANPYAGNPAIVFEQSDDNVSWGPLSVVRADNVSVASTVTLGPNSANASLMFDAALEGVNWIRARVTTGPTTNAMTIAILAGGLPFSPMISAVQQPLIKGFQGPTGVTTQDLKDSGRFNIAITAYQIAGIITTEALFAAATFASSRDGSAPTTGQQFTVTPGKRFRIQAIECSIKNTAAAAGTSKVALRYSGGGGTITNASPVLAIWDLGSNSTVAGNYIGPMVLPLPDGVELLSNSTFGFTNLSSAVTMLHTFTVSGYEY